MKSIMPSLIIVFILSIITITYGKSNEGLTDENPCMDRDNIPAPPGVTVIEPTGSNVSTLPRFDWEDVKGTRITYKLQVSDSYDFTNLVIEAGGLTSSEYQTQKSEELSSGTTYYWRVYVYDCGTQGPNPSAYTFETK